MSVVTNLESMLDAERRSETLRELRVAGVVGLLAEARVFCHGCKHTHGGNTCLELDRFDEPCSCSTPIRRDPRHRSGAAKSRRRS
jgi:hypothetical protein